MSFVNNLTLIVMTMNASVLCVFGYMLFAPIQLTETLNEPFAVTPHEVKHGETINFTVEMEKYRDYKVEINKNIICADGNLVTLAPSTSHAPTGKHTIPMTLVVPDKASLGECYVEFVNTYFINPFRTEQRVRVTEPFIVIE